MENCEWDWGSVFNFLAICSLVAGLLLIPCWNAMPKTVGQKTDNDEPDQT